MANNKGSKTEFLVKLVLVFFISLLSFSVGTFVGKQVSDSDYRRAALEGEMGAHRDTASVEEDEGHEGKKENALSEEEIASLTDEFIESEKKKIDGEAEEHGEAGKHGEEAVGDHPAAGDHEEAPATTHAGNNQGYKKFGAHEEASAHDTSHAVPSKEVAKKVNDKREEVAAYKKEIAAKARDIASTAAEKVAHNEAASTGVAEKRNPSSVLPSVASSAVGKYTVQIASYATEGEAKAHAAKLKDKGWNAFYIPAAVSGHTWFRVSVGLFNSAASAKNFQDELAKDGNITSSIVQKIIQ
jgi:cell division septation protein DedD